MSQELYEVLSLAARYLFTLLGLLIVLRAFLWQLASRAQERGLRRRIRDSGCIGELVVLSGGPSLREGTIIPVPWEGSLGSVRSCDVPVPCQGIRRRHLWFSWERGAGLRIQPLSGCEALVDGKLLDCRSWKKSAPMVHGSFLQVGSAVLRLRVFAALDSSAGFPEDEKAFSPPEAPGAFAPAAAVPFPAEAQSRPEYGLPFSAASGQPFAPPGPAAGYSDEMPPSVPPVPFPDATGPFPDAMAPFPDEAVPFPVPDNRGSVPVSDDTASAPAPTGMKPARRRRSERYSRQWEEDWSE